MIGKNISHYKILEKLGEGGMGVVYKAQDTKLDRLVALKFLPPHVVASEEEKARFVHEAKAAAALNHENICTVHEIDDFNDQTFIAMEYIGGQSLKEKTVKAPLKLEEGLDITIQIGEGLQEAHEKKIVHRDIKSANIMCTSKGQIKITDFGLAKLSGRTKVTKTGTTVGTAAYMSPEQAQGNEVDSRTDIWSLGVIIYEMISGQLPFKGDYEQAMMYSILNEEPEPLTGLRTGIPMDLERIVNKTLAKNPDERYQHVDELLVDLKNLKKDIESKVKTKATSQKKGTKNNKKLTIYGSIITFSFILIICGYFFWPNEKTPIIIVFPFSNSNENTNDYNIGLPFAAEIISNLAYTKTLVVRSFNTVRKYEDEEINVKTARNDENADFMVTGNYYLNEDKELHLIVELTDVHKDNSIWGETYDIPYADWQKCQDLISENVISNLDLQVSQTELNNMHADVSINPDAYEFYLRSISYPLSIEGCLHAIAMLENSIKLDSTYAPAYVELGFRVKYYGEIVLGGAEKYKEAEQFYLKALSLNSESTSCLGLLAGLYIEIGDVDNAVKLARRALTINPNDAEALFNLSYVYRYVGMLDESEHEGEKALKLDPNNQKFQSVVITYTYQGYLEKALKTMENFENNPFKILVKGTIYLRLGKLEKARDCFNRIIEMEPDEMYALYAECYTAVIDGNLKEGLKITRRLEKEIVYDSEMFYDIVNFYCLFNDYKNAVRMLNKTVEGGFFNYPFMQKDLFLDPMRNDPDFQRVLALAKDKHEAFKKKYFTK